MDENGKNKRVKLKPPLITDRRGLFLEVGCKRACLRMEHYVNPRLHFSHHSLKNPKSKNFCLFYRHPMKKTVFKKW